MNKWSIIHDYRRLTISNLAEDLRCPDDNAIYVVKIDQHDEPVLHCFLCSSTVAPGLSLWKQMESAVENQKTQTMG